MRCFTKLFTESSFFLVHGCVSVARVGRKLHWYFGRLAIPNGMRVCRRLSRVSFRLRRMNEFVSTILRYAEIVNFCDSVDKLITSAIKPELLQLIRVRSREIARESGGMQFFI